MGSFDGVSGGDRDGANGVDSDEVEWCGRLIETALVCAVGENEDGCSRVGDRQLIVVVIEGGWSYHVGGKKYATRCGLQDEVSTSDCIVLYTWTSQGAGVEVIVELETRQRWKIGKWWIGWTGGENT